MNNPRLRPQIPIMLGGSGERKTFRLAALFADHMNIICDRADLGRKVAALRQRCEEIGRDPATLRLSVNISRYVIGTSGSPRVELLAAYREARVDRVMGLLQESSVSDEPLESLAADARAAGCTLAPD